MINLLEIIYIIVKLLIALCIVATIHEFGHFLIAKLFKTQVNEFSIGFGPKIFQKEFKGTIYSLRWLPLGGYVSIEGEGEDSDNPNAFGNKNTFQKVAILLAGATFNAILAIVIFLSIALSYPTYNTQIVQIAKDSPLMQVGIKQGDEIVKINDTKVNVRNDLINQKYIDSKSTKIEYKRGNEYNTVTVDNAVVDIGYIGILFETIDGVGTNKIDIVDSGKVATKAGIKSGDVITHIDGNETTDSNSVRSHILNGAHKQLNFTINRNGEIIEKTITPDVKQAFDLGILETKEIKTNIKYAWYNSYNNVVAIVGSYVDLFKGKVKLTDMSGIVGIGEVVSKTSGIVEYLNLLGILSLAIGVANIMPFPPLDGGKIVIVLGEAIFRKKMPMKTEAIISYIGFALLILLTLVVTYNDILRIF